MVTDTRNRIGRFYWGATPTQVRVVLADTDTPYTKHYRLPALPPSYDPTEFTTDEPTNESVRRWKVSRWEGGEGNLVFDATDNRYNESRQVRPNFNRRGEGFVLGAQQEMPTQLTAGGDFNDGTVVGRAGGSLVAVGDSNYYVWALTGKTWGGAIAHGMPSGGKTPAVGFKDTAWYYGGKLSKGLYQFKSGASSQWVPETTLDDDYVIPIMFGKNLYALNGSDLYLVDQSTSDTVTLVADTGLYYDAALTVKFNRITTSDVGMVWFHQNSDDGATYLLEYNEATDTFEVISKHDIPRWTTPYDIFYANGFVFLTYRQAVRGTLAGDAWLYYQRGQQRGSIGPFPNLTDASTAGAEPLIAGMYGDLLVIVWLGFVWGYNFTTGGIQMIAETEGDTSDATSAHVIGDDILIANVDDGGSNDETVEMIEARLFTTDSGTHYIDLGRYDWGWSGLKKILLDVSVTTAPLPANTTVKVAYSIDGGSFVTAGGTWSTTGDTTNTFTMSTPTAPVVGESFEIRIILTTTDETVSPTIYEVVSRAMIDEKEVTHELQVDLGEREVNGYEYSEEEILSELQSLAAISGFVNFENPWHDDEFADPTTHIVKITEVGQPEVGDDGVRFVTVRAKERDNAWTEMTDLPGC